MGALTNPGSPEAMKAGCRCPVFDNGKGRGYMGVPGTFLINGDCPLHGIIPTRRGDETSNANKPKPKSDRMRWRETWSQKWGVVWQLVWKGRVVSEVKKDQRGDWALWINYGALSDDASANYEMHRANGCDEAKGMARKAVRDFLRSLNEQKASGQ